MLNWKAALNPSRVAQERGITEDLANWLTEKVKRITGDSHSEARNVAWATLLNAEDDELEEYKKEFEALKSEGDRHD